jgi:hypothetical protein
VKKVFKIIGTVLFTVLYVFILGFVNNDSTIQKLSSQQEVVKERFVLAKISNIAGYESESSENIFEPNQNTTFKKPFQDYFTTGKTLYDHFSVKFTLYNSVLRKFLLKFQKTDIIFPFHLFW